MDYTKVLKGLGIALAGAGLTYLAQLQFNFGAYTPLVVALAAALVNWGREYLKSVQPVE